MRQSNHEGFYTVRDKLDSIYDAIRKAAPVSTPVQELPSISTEPPAKNVQVPPIAIEAGSEDVNSSL